MRKWILAAVAAIPAAALAQSAATGGLSNFPDIPKAEPFSETVFGVKIDDPYRWMEKADRRAKLESWVNASSLHTTTEIAALPGREGLFKQMEALSRSGDRFFGVQQVGVVDVLHLDHGDIALRVVLETRPEGVAHLYFSQPAKIHVCKNAVTTIIMGAILDGHILPVN